MLLFVDNQNSCLKAYAVTLLDGCFSEARSVMIRINVDGKKKKRRLFRASNESMLDQTPNATNASAFHKENYARLSCSLQDIVRFSFSVIENASFAVITIFLRDFTCLKSGTKFHRLLLDNKRSK